jgi:MoxR-like ATPase
LIVYGGSPRASINLALTAKANAFLNKRGYVIPEDVRTISKDVLRHRIGLSYEAEAENVNVEDVIDDVLKAIQVP